MSKFKGTIVVDTERCKGCNLCAIACPQDLIQLSHIVSSLRGKYVQNIVKNLLIKEHFILKNVWFINVVLLTLPSDR